MLARRFLLVLTACLVTALACTSLDGLSDGTASAPDAALPDATAALDAPGVGDSATRRGGCDAGTFRFCDDFDERSSPEGGALGWGTYVDSLGRLTMSSEAWSSPNAVEARIFSSDAGVNARIDRTTTLVGMRTHVEMETRIDVGTEAWTDAASTAEVARILVPGAFFRLWVANDGVYLRVTVVMPPTPTETTFKLEPFSLGSWHHVDLDFLLDQSAGSVRVNVDGKVLVDRANVRTIGNDPAPVVFVTQLGVQSMAGTPSITARFDDVKIY